MYALIKFELLKLWRQKKSWAAMLTIVLLNLLMSAGFYMMRFRHGRERVPEVKEYQWDQFINALQYTQFILQPATMMLFPIMLAILSGYQLAGEFELGNLRMMLMRPVSRGQVLVAKFFTLSVYSGVMLLLLGVVSYTVARLSFNADGIVLIPGDMLGYAVQQQYHLRVIILSPEEEYLRIPLTYLLAWPLLMSVSAMALLFSVVLRHFTSAAIVTTTVYVCCLVVTEMPFLSAIHAYLPTRYWYFWHLGLLHQIPWDLILSHACWTFGYTAVFLALGTAAFNLRDV